MQMQQDPAMFNVPPSSDATFQGQQQTEQQVATLAPAVHWGQEQGGKLSDIVDPVSKKFYRDGPQGTIRESVFKGIISGGRIEWVNGGFGLPKRTAEVAGVSDRVSCVADQ